MTHYQLSFTSRQAMAFFIVCLAVLVLAFFLGLMAGLPARAPAPRMGGSTSPTPLALAGGGPITTAEAPDASVAADDGAKNLPADEATPPAVAQAFEDHAAAPTPTAIPAPGPVHRASPVPEQPAASGPALWIQLASVSSKSEADALAGRVGRHGFHAQVEAPQTA